MEFILNEKIKNIIGDKYNVLGQTGLIGSSGTIAILIVDENSNKYVLKFHENFDTNWIILQKEAIEQKNKYTKGYDGKINIPKVMEVGDCYIIEEYCGVEFYDGIYINLDEAVKKDLALNLALLLKNAYKERYQTGKDINLKWNTPLETIFDFYGDSIDDEFKAWILRTDSRLNNRDKSKDVFALTHGDIRSQNLLYDELRGQLSLIDYDLVEVGSIYRDFCAPSQFWLDYEFLFMIVHFYNQIGDDLVDNSLVADMNAYKTFRIYAGYSTKKDLTKDEKKDKIDSIKKQIKYIYECADKDFDQKLVI